MVNRYTLADISIISKTFKVDDENIKPIYNAFPTKKLPIISLNDSSNVSFEYWGSTDEFSKNNSLANRLINVDFSKVKKSNIISNQFKLDRCLIPCDGFYFWKNFSKKEKTPYYFKYTKDKLIYCVGIRETFQDFSGNNFKYFYFLTNQSTEKWKKFTPRIPILFDIRYLDLWFSKTTSITKISSFIDPIKFKDFDNYTVSPYFENKNKDDISLINRINNLNQYGNYSLFD
jgi:putative SOS response-associated peptidase YedK